MRHRLAELAQPFGIRLLTARDSVADVGRESGVRAEGERTLLSTVRANAKRVEESLRVLEELGRLPEINVALNPSDAEKLRYAVYDNEKHLSGRVARTLRAGMIRGLYVVIDRQAAGSRSLVKLASDAIDGGAGVIQLRDKEGARGDVYHVALEMNAVCIEKNALFIINDYADITQAVGAAGVHIGQRDLPLPVLRKLLSIDTIVGVSCENAVDVSRAIEEGADYLAVGAIFPTSQKANHVLVGIEFLRSTRECCGSIPLVAIGGIGPSNAKAVVEAGADAVAVIGSVVMQPDPKQAAADMVLAIQRSEEQ